MYAKYTGFFRTLKETSTGSPRDTCTRGAVDYRFISVLTKILKHPKWVLFYRKTCRETSTGTPRDTCTRGAADHQILDVSYNIYKLKHPFGCFFNQNGEGRDCRFGAGHTTVKSISDEVLFCVVFPIPGTRASLTLNSPFTVFEKRGFQKP